MLLRHPTSSSEAPLVEPLVEKLFQPRRGRRCLPQQLPIIACECLSQMIPTEAEWSPRDGGHIAQGALVWA